MARRRRARRRPARAGARQRPARRRATTWARPRPRPAWPSPSAVPVLCGGEVVALLHLLGRGAAAGGRPSLLDTAAGRGRAAGPGRRPAPGGGGRGRTAGAWWRRPTTPSSASTPTGAIVEWNAQAEAMFGWARAEVARPPPERGRDPRPLPGRPRGRPSAGRWPRADGPVRLPAGAGRGAPVGHRVPGGGHRLGVPRRPAAGGRRVRPRHQRAPPVRGPAGPPGPPRPPHRPAQPGAAPGPAGERPGPHPPPPVHRRPAHPRHRPLQGGQRQPRPRGRRPAAGGGGRAPGPAPAPGRHPGPDGRRRVRHALRGRLRPRRGRRPWPAGCSTPSRPTSRWPRPTPRTSTGAAPPTWPSPSAWAWPWPPATSPTPTSSCATPTWPCTGPSSGAGAASRCSTRPCAADAVDRLSVENDLRRAIRQGQLRLFYQPIVHIDTGQIAGFEALVRWQHPVRGLLSPADFIPPAEDTGLIVPLGRCVLGEACLQAAAWQRRRGAGQPLRMSVNVSAKQLQYPGWAAEVAGDPGRDRAWSPATWSWRSPRASSWRTPRPPSGPPRGAAPARRADRHRRLRHRLLVARLPPPPARRHPQDRQVVHRRGGQGPPRVGPGPGGGQAGPHPRPRRGGRGRHRPPPAGRAAPAALPLRPGLLLLPAPAARGGRRAAGARRALPAAGEPGEPPPRARRAADAGCR